LIHCDVVGIRGSVRLVTSGRPVGGNFVRFSYRGFRLIFRIVTSLLAQKHRVVDRRSPAIETVAAREPGLRIRDGDDFSVAIASRCAGESRPDELLDWFVLDFTPGYVILRLTRSRWQVCDELQLA